MASGLRITSPQHVYTDSSRLLYSGLERYQMNGTFSDIVVLTPTGKRLKCHQLVLAACSKKFAGALETGDFAGQELPVQGVDSDALEMIIRFFYTADCPITVSTAIPLLDAAIKLDVPGLTAACEQFVNQLLHPLTVVTFIEQSLNLKLDIVTDVLTTYIANRFEEVTQAHTFPNCEYSTFLKIILDNKQRQPESVLFKAVSKWILADNARVDLAEEIFRLLGISQASVQALVQQSALNLMQPGGGAGRASEAGGALPGLNAVQLLPASLALSALGHGRPSIGGQMGTGAAGAGDASLLTLMQTNPQLASQLNGGSVDGLRGVLAAASQQQLLQGVGGRGYGGDGGYGNDVGSPAGGGGRGRGGEGRRHNHGDERGGSGSGKVKRSRRDDGGGRMRSNDLSDPPHSPSAAIAAAKQALASGTHTLADYGLDPATIETMPTIGNHPPTMKGVCHVDFCGQDLTQLRDYHQRFKICDYHLKVSSILKDGVPQRFCQQCGRFHLLTEFDGNKRSCRARLQRHNARRRKRLENEAMGMDDGRDSGMDGPSHHSSHRQQQQYHEPEQDGLAEGLAMAATANTLANMSHAAASAGLSNFPVRSLESFAAALNSGLDPGANYVGAAAAGGVNWGGAGGADSARVRQLMELVNSGQVSAGAAAGAAGGGMMEMQGGGGAMLGGLAAEHAGFGGQLAGAGRDTKEGVQQQGQQLMGGHEGAAQQQNGQQGYGGGGDGERSHRGGGEGQEGPRREGNLEQGGGGGGGGGYGVEQGGGGEGGAAAGGMGMYQERQAHVMAGGMGGGGNDDGGSEDDDGGEEDEA